MFATTTGFCEQRVAADSIYGPLHRECFELFPEEMFADLFTDVGSRSVPPMIVAVVMVLQRLEGCFDREAVDRFASPHAYFQRRSAGLVGRRRVMDSTALFDARTLPGFSRPETPARLQRPETLSEMSRRRARRNCPRNASGAATASSRCSCAQPAQPSVARPART
jgi:hypothetical protein